MSRLFRKVVIILVLVIAVLQIIHITLMSRLEKKRQPNEKELRNKAAAAAAASVAPFAEQKYDKRNVAEDRNQMYAAVRSLSSVLDSSGEYRILSFIATSAVLKSSQWKYSSISKLGTLDGTGSGHNLYRRNDIALVTHATVYQLYHLPALAQRWHGLISVSVFVVSIQQIPLAIETILLLRYCSAFIRHRASFHLVYPLSLSAKLNNRQARSVLDFLKWPEIVDSYPELETFVHSHNCGHIQTAIQKLLADQIDANYNHKVPYPNNLLRNIARRYALTEYSLVIDADLMPSAFLYEHFLEFGKRTRLFKEWDSLIEHENSHESKVIFVLPTYEIDLNQTVSLRKGKASTAHHQTEGLDENELLPRTKEELILGIEQRNVRPFYIELCWKCQKYTDYEAWLHASTLINASNDQRIDILFEVLWHDPWEPFYISPNNVPFYDERFRQYGFNRISQVCELHIAGYKFAVLNNAFLVHKGFKTPNGFHADKDMELEHNRILFRQFKLQLKDRYPSSSRRC